MHGYMPLIKPDVGPSLAAFFAGMCTDPPVRTKCTVPDMRVHTACATTSPMQRENMAYYSQHITDATYTHSLPLAPELWARAHHAHSQGLKADLEYHWMRQPRR